MNRYFVLAALLLLALASAQEANISLNRAVALAQNRFPDLAVSPSSNPNYPAVVGGEEYWVVEFDNIWVPVSRGGEIIEDESAAGIFKVHYAIQMMALQRDGESYPTAKQSSFNAMLTDVTDKKQFLTTYKSDLPAEFDSSTNKLVSSVTQLEERLGSAGDAITAVRAQETKLLTSASSWDDFTEWRTGFSSLLDSITAIVTAGNGYEEDRGSFVQQANDYAADEGNDITMRNTVQAFSANTKIPNVPGAFPELETLVGEWKASWLEVALSDDRLGEDAQRLYTDYKELGSQSDIVSLRTEAFGAVSALEPKAAVLISKLGACEDELPASDAGAFSRLESSYGKARDAYDAGAAYESALNYPDARDEYRNAIAFAEDAEKEAAELAGVDCPAPPPPQQEGFIDIIIGFFTSLPGLITIGLAVLLVGLYWWNKRRQEGEYYEEEGYTAY